MPGIKVYLICTVITIMSSMLVLSITPHNVATTPDSISYLDAAQHISAGDGLVSTNYVFGAEQEFTPFKIWPPLYPAMLSVFPAITSAPLFAAVQAAMFILSLNSLLLFFILRKTIGEMFSFIAVAVFLISSANLIITTYAWSESLFISMLLFSILFSLNSYQAAEENKKNRLFVNLFLLAIALTGLFYTRYIGLIFGFILPLTWLFSPDRSKYITAYIISFLWYSILVIGFLFRNYLLGDVTGGDVLDKVRHASSLSILDNTWAVLDSLYLLIPNNVTLGIAILLASIALVFGIKRFISDKLLVSNANISTKQIKYQVLLLVMTVVIYLGALIVLRSITAFEEIRVRYIAVISPCLIMLMFIFFSYSIHSIFQSWKFFPLFIVNVAVVFLIVVQGVLVFKATTLNWKQYGTPNMSVTGSKNNIFYSHLTSQSNVVGLYRMIEAIGADSDDVIITEKPKLPAFISGMKFRRLNGGINQKSLEKLERSKEKGFILATQKQSKRAIKIYFSNEEEISSLPTVVSLPFSK